MELTEKDFFAVFSDLFLWPIVELAEKEKMYILVEFKFW